MAQDPEDNIGVNEASNEEDIAAAKVSGPSETDVCGTCGNKIRDDTGNYDAKYQNGQWYHDNSDCIKQILCIYDKCENNIIDTTKGYIPQGPYHIDCYYLKISPCSGCNKNFDKNVIAIKDIRITVSFGNFHSECFKCASCDQIISDSKYGIRENKPIHIKCDV